MRIVCVKKISGCLTRGNRVQSLFFVNFFAVFRNRFVCRGFPGVFRPTWMAETKKNQGLKGALSMQNRLARMLRLKPGQMIDPFCLVEHAKPIMMSQPTPTADMPRGDELPRGFLFFDFFREIFHRWVCTPSRPLRGGKEGPACRAM